MAHEPGTEGFEGGVMWQRDRMTPGHSRASMCIDIDGMLFTGDTIMPFPRYLNKKDGNLEDWKKSVAMLESKYSDDTLIFPGHGKVLTLGEWKKNFYGL